MVSGSKVLVASALSAPPRNRASSTRSPTASTTGSGAVAVNESAGASSSAAACKSSPAETPAPGTVQIMDTPLRRTFHQELDDIDANVVQLFALVTESLAAATETFLA